MTPRPMKYLTGALLLVLSLSLTSCAAKYEEMLRHRDETVRDLEARLATSKSANADLRRQNQALTAENGELKARKPETKVVSAPRKSSLDELENELKKGGADVTVRSYRRGLAIGIPNRVSFAPGKTRLTTEGQRTIQTVGRLIRKRFPTHRIYVEGHTDSDPIRKTKKLYKNNRHLSAMRAEAVASYLTKSVGLPEDRLVILGYGPYEPLVRGEKARNRRVEIVVSN